MVYPLAVSAALKKTLRVPLVNKQGVIKRPYILEWRFRFTTFVWSKKMKFFAF